MNKVHARMTQKLAHENAVLRYENEMLEEAIEEANDEIERLKAASIRCITGLIESAGEEFQDSDMPPDVQEAVIDWLNCVNPGVDNLSGLIAEEDRSSAWISDDDPTGWTDEKEDQLWEEIRASFDDEEEDDDTYYSPKNRISHLFGEEDEA